MGAAWEADLAKYDERGVIIPAPLHGYDGGPRYDDEHRGPAVAEAYSLSRCWMDLAEHSRRWPSPASIPDGLKAIAQNHPVDGRDAWLKDAANRDEVDRLLSYALRSGELPLWVAPLDGPEKPVPAESILEMSHATMVSGTYQSHNDRGRLYGRPLFVKWHDWVRFVSVVNADKAVAGVPDPKKPILPPDEHWVSLSHALTWIAFGVSMDSARLHEVLTSDRYGEHDPQEAIKAALNQLVDLGRAERLAMQGKYRERYREGKRALLTAPIEPIKFADFRQFNYLSDELRHGEGLTWWRSVEGVINRLAQGGRADSFIEVGVNRQDLMRQFRPHGPLELKADAVLWSDLEPEEKEQAKAFAQEAETDEWWNWPQAVAWVGCRNLEHIATMRLCADPWKRGRHDLAVALGAEHFLGTAYCSDLQMAERDLQRAIEGGAVRTQGRPTQDAKSEDLRPTDWRGGKVVYYRTATLVSAANILSEWACDIAVHRGDLWAAFPAPDGRPTAKAGGKVPNNRQLDHEEIIARAEVMREERPDISLGSAAASIRAELPPNPKTGKLRDQRGIERIISHPWEGKATQSPS